jgi:hypothetical protein
VQPISCPRCSGCLPTQHLSLLNRNGATTTDSLRPLQHRQEKTKKTFLRSGGFSWVPQKNKGKLFAHSLFFRTFAPVFRKKQSVFMLKQEQTTIIYKTFLLTN